MELTLHLPTDTVLNKEKIEALDKLCAVFPPEEMQEFYKKHELEMVLTTEEQLENRTAIADLIGILCRKG